MTITVAVELADRVYDGQQRFSSAHQSLMQTAWSSVTQLTAQ
jgi:hypothetical protein